MVRAAKNNSSMRIKGRGVRGQALIESACGMVVITMFFVGLLMLGINIYAVTVYDSQLRLVAEQAARSYDDHKYWLGMTRADYSEQQAAADATNLAIWLADTYGIEMKPQDVKFERRDLNVPITAGAAPQGKIVTTGVTCTLSFDRFKLPFGGHAFPLLVKRQVSATVADMSLPAPAMLDINGFNNLGTQTTVSIPAYYAYKPIGVKQDANGDSFGGTGTGQAGAAPTGPIRHNWYYALCIQGGKFSNPQNADGQYIPQR